MCGWFVRAPGAPPVCLELRAGMLSTWLPFARVFLMLFISRYFEHQTEFV